MDSIQMPIVLTPQERRWLERLAKKETRSLNSQVKHIIKKYVEDKYPDMMVENVGGEEDMI